MSRKTLWGVLCLLAVGGAALLQSASRPLFNSNQKAFYADEKTVNFVRPGLVFKITNTTIASDGTVTTRFRMTDPAGLPLDREGILTPGTVSTTFILAKIPKGGRAYQAYTQRVKTSAYPPTLGLTARQAGADSGGRFVKVADGEYDYIFGTKLPAGYEKDATHTIAAYGSRNLAEFELGTYYGNALSTWVPDGTAVKDARDVINDQSCNACHDELAFHGGSRRGLPTCILCHAPAYDNVTNVNPETGNTIDMPVMIHKIHMGSLLPSVKAGTPYRIIRSATAINDYSHVALPSEVNNCGKCHDTSATQANTWNTRPSAAACGACHDDVNFASGQNHANGIPVTDAASCARCHIPEGDRDFDSSIKGAHKDPTQSSLITGIVGEITSVESTGAGEKPVVNFTVKDRKGAVLEPAKLNRVAFTLAGPTTDYGEGLPTKGGYVTEMAGAATATSSGWRFQFAQAIPATAKGTYVVWMEARRQEVVLEGTVKQRTIQTGADNVFKYFSVDGSDVVPRREIVELKKCNDCHRDLSLHGENRDSTGYCVVCHNPRETDSARRPATAGAPESINFSNMIHRIHAGDAQGRDYTIYGYGNTPHNYNGVIFPGVINNCQNCHLAGTSDVPVKAKLDVTDPRGWITSVKPTTAACGGCHTSVEAASHALVNTSVLGESCAACHGPGKDYAVSKVHAQ